MAGASANSECTVLLHQVGCLGNGTGSINHIVDNHYILTCYITNNLHRFYHVGAGTGLVTQYQWAAQVLGVGVGTL